MSEQKTSTFTSYQKLVILLLALTQFSVILDFMVMSPLGDILMKSLSLSPKEFAVVVSAYALSAGISGLLTAGFADKFDRKNCCCFFMQALYWVLFLWFIPYLCGISSGSHHYGYFRWRNQFYRHGHHHRFV